MPSRTRAGPLTFGLRGRIYLSVFPVAIALYGWWGIVRYWGSPRMLLDLLWTPAVSILVALWLRDVWATTR